MHVSNSFNIFFIEIPSIGTLDAIAYIDLEPLQLRSSDVGGKRAIFAVDGYAKYIKTLTFSIICWFIVKLCFF